MKCSYSDRFSSIPAMVLEIEAIAHGTARKIRLDAKIDTGADLTVLPAAAIRSLRILEFGSSTIHAVNHEFKAPTYLADILLDDFRFESLRIVAHNKPYALLGRDVLNQLTLIADGPNETFELIHPNR